jgi:hypothetical protein
VGGAAVLVLLVLGVVLVVAGGSSDGGRRARSAGEGARSTTTVAPEADRTTAPPTTAPVGEGGTPAAGGSTSLPDPAGLTTEALDTTWDRMSPAQRTSLCDGIERLGADAATDLMVAGVDSGTEGGAALDRAAVRAWLADAQRSRC